MRTEKRPVNCIKWVRARPESEERAHDEAAWKTGASCARSSSTNCSLSRAVPASSTSTAHEISRVGFQQRVVCGCLPLVTHCTALRAHSSSSRSASPLRIALYAAGAVPAPVPVLLADEARDASRERNTPVSKKCSQRNTHNSVWTHRESICRCALSSSRECAIDFFNAGSMAFNNSHASAKFCK